MGTREQGVWTKGEKKGPYCWWELAGVASNGGQAQGQKQRLTRWELIL